MTQIQDSGSNKPRGSYGEVQGEEEEYDYEDDNDDDEDGMSAEKDENEAIIAVMGMTGAGKSSFISLLSNENVQIGHDLESSTTSSQSFNFTQAFGSGYLIDTPGFDDTSLSDTEILKEIAACFCTLYAQGLRLDCIIYLHRISDPRMSGSAIKNLNMLQKLCGTRSLSNVMIVTTMWGELSQQNGGMAVGERREEELKSSDEFWGGMLRYGSKVMRHTGDQDSALRILASIMQARTKTVLDIQREMVDQNMPLDQTSAGKYLKREYAELMHKYKKEGEEIQKSKLAAMDDEYREMIGEMDDEVSKLTRDMAKIADADQSLKLDYQLLREEKSRSFQERERSFSINIGETAPSPPYKTNTSDARRIAQLESSIQTLKRNRQAEEERLLAQRTQEHIKAQDVSAENQVMADLVRSLALQERELKGLVQRENRRQGGLRRCIAVQKRPQRSTYGNRGVDRDLATMATMAAQKVWRFLKSVWDS